MESRSKKYIATLSLAALGVSPEEAVRIIKRRVIV